MRVRKDDSGFGDDDGDGGGDPNSLGGDPNGIDGDPNALGGDPNAVDGGNYNPDEPRDYHGRWTSGGGDAKKLLLLFA